MKKTLLFAFIWAALGVTAAQAGVMITFDNPNQSGAPGSTLQYYGWITNLDTENAVYLNSDSLNLIADPEDFFLNDHFFANVPLTLGAEATSDLIELFSVVVADPFLDAFTTYTGSYQLIGGLDVEAAEILGTAAFTTTAVSADTPEPGPASLIIIGVAAIAVFRRRTNRGPSSPAGPLRRRHKTVPSH